MLVIQLNQPALNEFGLGMRGCFATVEDMLVLGVDRAVRSRPNLRDKCFLITFTKEETVLIYKSCGETMFCPFSILAGDANKRLDKFAFIAINCRAGDDRSKALIYNLSVPEDEKDKELKITDVSVFNA